MKSFLSLNCFRVAGPAAALALTLLPALHSIAQSPVQVPTTPGPAVPVEPDQRAQPAACPIRVDEAYLTAEPNALPADAASAKRALHATLVDVSGKTIVSYVVHAKIAIRPSGTLTNAPQTANVSRRWHGDLEPDTPTKEQWTFDADRFTMGLRRVWFDKVTFADGTVWDKAPNDRCSFAATGHIVQTKSSSAKH